MAIMAAADAATFASFDTKLGRCRIGWTERGISRVRLPETDATRGRDAASTPVEPPEAVAAVIRDIVAHLDGEPRDFSSVALDWSGLDAFARRVYAATREIP